MTAAETRAAEFRATWPAVIELLSTDGEELITLIGYNADTFGSARVILDVFGIYTPSGVLADTSHAANDIAAMITQVQSWEYQARVDGYWMEGDISDTFGYQGGQITMSRSAEYDVQLQGNGYAMTYQARAALTASINPRTGASEVHSGCGDIPAGLVAEVQRRWGKRWMPPVG
jgi:hypothetical protein